MRRHNVSNSSIRDTSHCIAAERNPANTANTGDAGPGFDKVGGAALYVNQNIKRIKLNTGNPHRLDMRQYVQVLKLYRPKVHRN